MPYVSRHADNTVYGIWSTEQFPGQEFLLDGHPDLVLPIPIPASVSRAQGRAALHLASLLSTVEAIIADPAIDPMTVIAYEADTWRRTSPTLIALAGQLNLTDAQLDNLFITAAGIEL